MDSLPLVEMHTQPVICQIVMNHTTVIITWQYYYNNYYYDNLYY